MNSKIMIANSLFVEHIKTLMFEKCNYESIILNILQIQI